jgi:signal transduction histidine kinase
MIPWLDVSIISFGIIVIAVALARHVRLAARIESSSDRRFWLWQLLLMVFFVFTYLAITLMVVLGESGWLLKAVSILLLGGAVFVLLTVMFSRRMIRTLRDHNLRLEETVDRKTRNLQVLNQRLETTVGDLRLARDQLVLREKLAMLGSLGRGLVHELNNPLGYVQSNLQVLRRSLPGRAGSRQEGLEILRDCLEGIQRIRELVSSFERLGTDSNGGEPEIVSLDELAREVVDELEAVEAPIRTVMLRTESTTASIVSRRDVRTAVASFLSILVQGMFDDGRGDTAPITVSVLPDNGAPVLEIADPSVSLSEAEKLRFFDPEVRKDHAVRTMRLDMRAAIAHRLLLRNCASVRIWGDDARGTVLSIDFAPPDNNDDGLPRGDRSLDASVL